MSTRRSGSGNGNGRRNSAVDQAEHDDVGGDAERQHADDERGRHLLPREPPQRVPEIGAEHDAVAFRLEGRGLWGAGGRRSVTRARTMSQAAETQTPAAPAADRVAAWASARERALPSRRRGARADAAAPAGAAAGRDAGPSTRLRSVTGLVRAGPRGVTASPRARLDARPGDAHEAGEPLGLRRHRRAAGARDPVVALALALVRRPPRRLVELLNPSAIAEVFERAVQRGRPEPDLAVAQRRALRAQSPARADRRPRAKEDVVPGGFQRLSRARLRII